MPRYLTRFKLRQKKSPLMKLAKAAVSAIDELFEEYESEDDENILEKVDDYLEEEMEKEDGMRARILKELKRCLKKEEPGETDDEEDIEGEEEGDVEEDEVMEDEEVHDEQEENLEEDVNPVEKEKNTENAEEHSEEEENVVDGEGEAEEDEFLVENDSIENAIGNATPDISILEKYYSVSEVSLVDLLADQSVTAPDGTFTSLFKDLGPSRSCRSTSLFDLGSNKSHSLASLLTAVPPTPLRSVGSVSEQSLYVEETLSRRARRSSQDLAHHLLYNERMASPLCRVSAPMANIGTPTAVDKSINLNAGFVTPQSINDSVICLGTVKKPTPPLITIDDTPRRRTIFPREQQTTPQMPMDFVGVRARLRRVPGSPMEQEMRQMATEVQASPVLGGTTDRHVTDMEISPAPIMDRQTTDEESSPAEKSSSSELEDLPVIPPKPRPRHRRTPFPEELRKKK